MSDPGLDCEAYERRTKVWIARIACSLSTPMLTDFIQLLQALT
jgi:hypothetical protein